jgi:uncharacterized protein YecT (DUF1311 family)
MRTNILSVGLAFVSFWPIYAVAQESPKPAASDRIITTVEMREDAMNDFNKADSQLNLVYRKLLSRLTDKNQQAKLRNSQQAWLKYRDSYAEFEASFYEGGTIQVQFHTSFLTKMTESRVKELQNTLENEFDH